MSAGEQFGGGTVTPQGTTDNGTAAPVPKEKVVSYDVFQRVVEARAGLEGLVRELQGQVKALSERATEAETRYGAYTEFSGAVGSTDPDVVAAFDGKYRALPEQGRPDRKSWVESLRAAPDEAPALLRPWLAHAATPGTSATRPPAPRVPGTPPTPPGAPSSVSAEEVARVREEAVRSGDWSKWRELSVSMGIRPARK